MPRIASSRLPRDSHRRLKVSVNDTERQQLQAKARQAGMPVSAYLRTAALAHGTAPASSSLLPFFHISAELQKIAALLQQLSPGEAPTAARIELLCSQLLELRQQTSELISLILKHRSKAGQGQPSGH